MSYNIDDVKMVSGGPLRFESADVARRLAEQYEDELPSLHLLDYVDETGEITTVYWDDEGSGRSFDTFKKVLEQTKGQADLVLCWERGDSYSGLRVHDGVVTEQEVVMMLREHQ